MIEQQSYVKACFYLHVAKRIRRAHRLGRLIPAIHGWYTTRIAELMVRAYLQARIEREARVASKESALVVRTYGA